MLSICMAKAVMPEQESIYGTLLGFDFGLRRIGVAVGQTATRTAGALVTIAHNSQADWQAIEKLIKEWKPVALIVGLPLDMQGLETEMSRAARRFAAELEQRYKKQVYFADERLTSRAAGTEFAEARAQGRARKKDAGKLDAMAAKIILENWLQSQSVAATTGRGD
jgi:putative Holliday junction resolvase